ncbi:MAG: amidohydrolase family protein [Bryobacteraceae bacterium]
MKKTVLAAGLLWLAGCSQSPAPSEKSASNADATVLENVTLIDGTGRAPVADAAIIVSAGRIQYAGPKAGMPAAPAGAAKVDLSGKFVMPGIINTHGHVGNTIGIAQDPKNFTPENVNAQLGTYARYGVTTVVSMGSEQPLILEVRDKQRAGRPNVARVFTALRGFTGKGGYPTTAQGMKGVPYEVETVEQVEKDVEELAAKKVDLVKIWVDDHLGKERKIPMDLSKAIIENAHKRGLKVAAHVFYLDDAKKLVAAGLDGIAHSVRDKPVDDELIKLMKEKGAWQSAATFMREYSVFCFAKPDPMLEDPFFTRSIATDVLTTLKSKEFQAKQGATHDAQVFPAFLATAKKNLKKLVDSGVKFSFGTDTGPPLRFSGYYEHKEMEHMVEAGLTPMQVIESFSKNSAEFIGASKDLGTVESGHWADFVVLGKNPVEDIKNTQTIESVWIAGSKVN